MRNFAHQSTLVMVVSAMLGPILATAAEVQVITYPFPAGLPASDRFHVTADGQPVFSHAAEVADFAMFAIRGPVQVTVECEQTVTSAIVRPLSRKIVPQWEARTVRFTVDGSRPLSVEVNGQIRPALFLFIDPTEESPPPPDAPKVVVPPRSFLVNSGGELSGVTFQNLRQGDRVLTGAEDLGLSVEGGTEVRFAR